MAARRMYFCFLLISLLISSSARIAVISNKARDSQIAICTCAKCGSSSMFTSVYNSIPTNDKIPKKELPHFSIFNMDTWGIKRIIQAKPGISYVKDITFFHMYRDPIDRYISAYHSKLKCCNENEFELRSACYQDTGFDDLHRNLMQLAYMPDRSYYNICFTFREYVNLLSIAKTTGNRARLNEHFLPQDLTCADFDKRIKKDDFQGNITTIAEAFKKFDWKKVDMEPVIVTHLHSTSRHDWNADNDSLQILCQTTKKEYDYFRIPQPSFCKK